MAGQDRRGQKAEHERDDQQPGVGGRGAVDGLEEEGQEADGAEHGDAERQPDAAGQGEGAEAEQPQGQQGLGGAPFDHDEGGDQDRGGNDEPDDGGGAPGILRATPGGGEHDRRDRGGEHGGADGVDVYAASPDRWWEH